MNRQDATLAKKEGLTEPSAEFDALAGDRSSARGAQTPWAWISRVGVGRSSLCGTHAAWAPLCPSGPDCPVLQGSCRRPSSCRPARGPAPGCRTQGSGRLRSDPYCTDPVVLEGHRTAPGLAHHVQRYEPSGWHQTGHPLLRIAGALGALAVRSRQRPGICTQVSLVGEAPGCTFYRRIASQSCILDDDMHCERIGGACIGYP